MFRRFVDGPIVLGGCGRSGTTLLLSILSCHPHICAIPLETQALCPTAYRQLDLSAPLDLDSIAQALRNCESPSTATRWCEKTPKNVLFFGRIIETLGPAARLIHVVRDGRDVVTSVHPSDPERLWVTRQRWVDEVSAGLAFADHPQVLTVRYEDLVTSFEPELKRLCSFLDEAFDDAFLRYPEAARVRKADGWFTEARPIDAASVGRWRLPEHRDVVRELMQDERAAALLERLGY